MVKSRYIGDGHPIFNRNPYNGYINPYYWVDDHPLLYGNSGSLDPGTYMTPTQTMIFFGERLITQDHHGYTFVKGSLDEKLPSYEVLKMLRE